MYNKRVAGDVRSQGMSIYLSAALSPRDSSAVDDFCAAGMMIKRTHLPLNSGSRLLQIMLAREPGALLSCLAINDGLRLPDLPGPPLLRFQQAVLIRSRAMDGVQTAPTSYTTPLSIFTIVLSTLSTKL